MPKNTSVGKQQRFFGDTCSISFPYIRRIFQWGSTVEASCSAAFISFACQLLSYFDKSFITV